MKITLLERFAQFLKQLCCKHENWQDWGDYFHPVTEMQGRLWRCVDCGKEEEIYDTVKNDIRFQVRLALKTKLQLSEEVKSLFMVWFLLASIGLIAGVIVIIVRLFGF